MHRALRGGGFFFWLLLPLLRMGVKHAMYGCAFLCVKRNQRYHTCENAVRMGQRLQPQSQLSRENVTSSRELLYLMLQLVSIALLAASPCERFELVKVASRDTNQLLVVQSRD
jgi:hypothetical protein